MKKNTLMGLIIGLVVTLALTGYAQTNAAAGVPPSASGGMAGLALWIVGWVDAHPNWGAILVVMGLLRVVFKPLMTVLERFYLDIGHPDQAAMVDKFEAAVEKSLFWRLLNWLLDTMTSIKGKPTAQLIGKWSGPGIGTAMALGLIGLMVLMCGCKTALQSDKIIVLKQRCFGVVVETSSTTANGTPTIKLGSISTVWQMVPTSTNTLYAPRYMDTYDLSQSVNPFDTSIRENSGFGDVMVGYSTNDSSKAIVPSAWIPHSNTSTNK